MGISARILVAAALVAPGLLVVPLPEKAAAAVAVTLLCVLPGAALARALSPRDPVLAILLAVTGSLAVTIAVSTLLLYLRLWSGPAVAVAVALLTVLFVRWGERGRDRDLA